MKTVVLIGDSIRMGYQSHVQQALQGLARVWAPQENGGNSQNVLEHLETWVINQNPDIVHLNCGLHDIKKPFETAPLAGQPAIPLDAYQTNVREILTYIRDRTQAQIIWATTTPVNEVWHHKRKAFDRFEADVLAYNTAATEIAQALNVPINDLYTVVMHAGRDDYLAPDGVHYIPSGYTMLGQAVVTTIKPYLITSSKN